MERTGPGYLEFDQVSFSWPNGVNVIDQCSFLIAKPGLWMLVGENGSGKSTLFRLISGSIRPKSGKIFCSLRPSIVYQNPDHQLLMPTCKSELMLCVPKTIPHSNLLDLIQSALEKVEDKRVTVLVSEITAVQIYEKTSSSTSKRPGFSLPN